MLSGEHDQLFELALENESKGMARDQAIQAAVEEVALSFGIGKVELLNAIDATELSLSTQLTEVERNLDADVKNVANLVGKPAFAVTQADIDFVVDLIAQENISSELITKYDVTGDGIVDMNDQTLLETTLQSDTTTIPATGLYLQSEQDTQAIMDQNIELNTQLNTQIDTQSAALAQQAQDTEFRRMRDDGMFKGANLSATTPDPVDLDYIYDFESIFATPEQEGLFASPYGSRRTRPANKPTGPMPRASGFAQGGQVEDENDMLLRILGDM